MGQLIGAAALFAVLAWLLGFGKRTRVAAPEDDTDTPLDADELAEAEADVMGEGARPINEALAEDEDDEDWGPGTSRSNLPGIG
jgi:hypothetical protein